MLLRGFLWHYKVLQNVIRQSATRTPKKPSWTGTGFDEPAVLADDEGLVRLKGVGVGVYRVGCRVLSRDKYRFRAAWGLGCRGRNRC